MDKERLTGAALASRLKRLADDANTHHHEVEGHWQGLLDHARHAGEALIEAKWRLGHRTKWSKWRRNHFEGSKETACNYMRVARHWDDPRIQQARAAGVTIDSINKFLKFLRGDTLDNDDQKPSQRELEIEMARDDLRKSFAAKLRTLDAQELKVLADQFDERSWPKLHEDLKQTVCQVTESDYYNEESPREKRKVRAKVSNARENRKQKAREKANDALNGKRRTRQLAKAHPK